MEFTKTEHISRVYFQIPCRCARHLCHHGRGTLRRIKLAPEHPHTKRGEESHGEASQGGGKVCHL